MRYNALQLAWELRMTREACWPCLFRVAWAWGSVLFFSSVSRLPDPELPAVVFPEAADFIDDASIRLL